MKRVVITGIGALTPLGNSMESTWESLVGKRSGIGPITRFDASGLPSRIAGELKEFNPEEYLPRKDILRLDPFIHYAAAAAVMACDDAGLMSLNPSPVTRHPSLDSAGIVIGSSRGGISSMDAALTAHLIKGKQFSAYLMSSSTISMAASYVSMRFGTKGQVLGMATACASGTSAIGEAFRSIRNGSLDVMIAGGAEAPLCKLALGGYGSSGSLSKRNDNPAESSRPFDQDRDGFVIAEGAGILVLEELDHALNRGADIYAEIIGCGTSSDAFHQTQPKCDGEADAITKALKDADVAVENISYLNAHATSTPLGDREEAAAVRKVFGRHTSNVYVTACKSMLGHMLGAAGAVEAAVTALSIHKGIITPTKNLENIDPDCTLNHVTSVLEKDIEIAVTNSFGFGGVNAVLVLKKYRV